MKYLIKFLTRYEKLVYTVMMIIPWLTAPFLGKRIFKRFTPGALFICMFVLVEGMFAHKKLGGYFHKKLFPKVIGELPLIIGPFFIGTLWIMKFTYGNLKRYFITNFSVNAFFVYIQVPILKKLGYASLIRLSKFRFFLIFLFKAGLLYIFQFFYEKKNKLS
ncbi:hypothetical protein [Bacillus sp. 7884-1]|uniref:hypothetical protein n=1 Tax=Bacillus sp. 7884-1 TaxID=2021693 RepID=UPI00211D0244|nr:hypothetical protein [Bacillus sp. 7884-1]